MKISLSWLREFVDVDLPVRELVDRLAMIGLVAEEWAEAGGDVVLNVETYANRPDTLGHLGMAREVAAMLERPLRETPRPVVELPDRTEDLIGVQIADEDLCGRYAGLVVKGLRVGPSPDWLRARIEAMGGKSINNVVDISNYVLFATGQPIHAFDLAKLAGPRIVVRRAKKGETLRTLDGRDVALTSDMLVIADERRPAALAGVIGGAETAVMETTRDVFIESAWFDPASIRRTRIALGVQTDASYRFERGADIGFAPEAARLAASLLAEFGGRVSKGVLDVYPRPRKTKEVVVRARRVTALLGVEVPKPFIERTMTNLGFGLKPTGPGAWRLQVPTYRVDVEREADVIEEVARFFGYDKIPSAVPPLEILDPTPTDRERVRRLSRQLCHFGFDEVVNPSFADPEREAVLASGRTPVALRNPFSIHAAVLRTTLLGGLLENVRHNHDLGTLGVHIFEVGNIFCRTGESAPIEDPTLGLMSTGPIGGPHWKGGPGPTDPFLLKGAIEAAAEALRYAPLAFEPAAHPFFEAGSSVAVLYRGERIGALGLVRKELSLKYGILFEIYAAEIELGALLAKSPRPFAYAAPPRYPAMVRDLSFLIDRDVPYQAVRDAVERAAVPNLESFEVVDRYAGPNIPPGRASLSLRFVFRNPQATLQAEEAERSEQKVLKALKAAFQIQLREGGAP